MTRPTAAIGVSPRDNEAAPATAIGVSPRDNEAAPAAGLSRPPGVVARRRVSP